MELLGFIVLVMCLILVAVQDLKCRKIHIVLPVVVFISSCLISLKTISYKYTILPNITFVIVVISFMVMYMTLKYRAFKNPFKYYFGLGDLLFYLSITPLFLLNQFVVYFIGSLVVSLLIFMIFKGKIQSDSIPLAGFCAIFLLTIITLDKLINSWSLTVI